MLTKNNEFNIENLLVYLIYLIPIVDIIGIYINKFNAIPIISITKYLILLILISLFIIIKRKLFFKSLLLPFYVLMLLNVFFAHSFVISLKQFIPLMVMINLAVLFFSGEFPSIKMNKKFINVVFFVILAGFYLFIVGVENMQFKDIYTGFYHAGIFDLPHKAAYYLLIIVLYKVVIDKKYDFFFWLSFIGVVLSGARSAIIAMVVFLLFDLVFSFNKLNIKTLKKWITFGSGFVIFIFLLSIVTIPFIDNLTARLITLSDFSSGDEYGSGRVGIASILLNEIFSRNIINLMIGEPVERVFNITESEFGTAVWAHNDFIMLLFVLGILGLLIFSYYLFVRPIIFLRKKGLKISLAICVLSCVFILAATNGFYLYYMGNMFFYIIIHVTNYKGEPF